jgi:hypothetical protein
LSQIRYLLDENTPHAVRNRLLQREPNIEVSAVGDSAVPPIGTPDAELLRWIEENGYILVSRNRRTLPQHLKEHVKAGHHVPGILLLRRQCPLSQLIEDLLLIWESGDPKEYEDQLIYLPL